MNHTWEIHNLKRNLSDGLVTTASYHCRTELSDESARSVGNYNLPALDPSDPSFISYDNLTEATVLSWVTGSLDTAAIYSKHSSSIAESIVAKNAITEGDGTPW